MLMFKKNLVYLQSLFSCINILGPRFSLVCNKIFSGSFGGPVLYINDDYVSPNTVSLSFFKLVNKY